jgi:uncharacterized protein (DUF302 family)
MIYRFHSLFLLFALFWTGAIAAADSVAMNRADADAEPMILTTTAPGKNIDQAVTALSQAIVNHNYTFVRQQSIDSRLVPYAEEVRSVRLVYFCNFAKMDRALRIDPRATQMLPCRVTLVETSSGVDLIAVNPAWTSQSMPALREVCQELKQDYLDILDEAAL